MHTQFVMSIATNRQYLDDDPRQFRLHFFDFGHDILTDVNFQPNRFKRTLALCQTVDNLLRIHAKNRRRFRHDCRRHRLIARQDRYRKTGATGNHKHPVAIVKITPGCHHIHVSGAVTFSQSLILISFDQLQVAQATDQRRKNQDKHQRQDVQPLLHVLDSHFQNSTSLIIILLDGASASSSGNEPALPVKYDRRLPAKLAAAKSQSDVPGHMPAKTLQPALQNRP